jgi:hypothetical protein
MSHEVICTWLGLPADPWPPDHYTLLGLEPGQADPERIERQVHERLDRVRCYQLTHPEQVTEAMNRLAQAFVCLTDPVARKAYDAALFPDRAAAAGAPLAVLVGEPRAAEPARAVPWESSPAGAAPPPAPQTEIDWATSPPPPRLLVGPPAPVPFPPAGDGAPAPAAPGAPAFDPVLEAARNSVPARRGLGTKRALYHRIARTRRLLHVWDQAGKYLGEPTRRVTRPAEATELIRQLTTIRELLRGFPPLLGEAGQPGYLVLALARQQAVVPTFQSLLPSQRAALVRDWQAGRALLSAHRQFLRQEVRALRRKSAWGQALRATRAAINDHPGWVLVALALLAMVIALWRD